MNRDLLYVLHLKFFSPEQNFEMPTISSGVEGPRKRAALDVFDLDLGRTVFQRKVDMCWNLSKW